MLTDDGVGDARLPHLKAHDLPRQPGGPGCICADQGEMFDWETLSPMNLTIDTS